MIEYDFILLKMIEKRDKSVYVILYPISKQIDLTKKAQL